jgi:hypothetical protein
MDPEGKRYAGALLEELAGGLDTAIGVDASRARGGELAVIVEVESGGVGEQMTQGRALRPGGFVKAHLTRVHCVEDAEHRNRLRHRRESTYGLRAARDGQGAPRTDHCDGGRNRPGAQDGVQIHGSTISRGIAHEITRILIGCVQQE